MTDLEFFRHTLATIAYRAGKAIRSAPATFADFKAGGSSKTPVQIVAHMSDLLEWSHTVVIGDPEWHDHEFSSWEDEVARFYKSLKRLDDYLKSGSPVNGNLAKLFQGPITGCLIYIGRLDMLRRRLGSPVKREIYFEADIEIGQVGPDQAAPRVELDSNGEN